MYELKKYVFRLDNIKQMWLSKIFLDSNFTSNTSGTTIIVGNAAGRSQSKKTCLSYFLYHHPSLKSRSKCPAFPGISRNKQKDRQKLKTKIFWYTYGVYIGTYMHLVKIGFFNVTTTYYNFINLYRFYTILKLTGRECFGY